MGLFTLLTILGSLLAVGGLLSLRRLLQLPLGQQFQSRDPFSQSIAILFAAEVGDVEFRRLQRRTIWLFCGAMLVLYLARLSV